MWQIVGHERAVEALRQALAAGRLPHALLLVGPGGVGKTHLALQLARAVNCEGENPPDGRCRSCRQIEAGSHPDVALIEPREGKETIAIEQVRELRSDASLRPFQGRKKVFIIAGAENLTAQAADALLKTLEEPQPEVLIVLTANDAGALPATVVSRCRQLTLGSVPSDLIARALEERGQPEPEAERLARLAQGSMGWALQAAAQPKLAAQRESTILQVCEALGADLGRRLELAESLAGEKKDRADMRRRLELLLLVARDALLLSEGLPPQLAAGEARDALAQLAAGRDVEQLHDLTQRLRLTMQRIDQNVDPRLALEALLVSGP